MAARARSLWLADEAAHRRYCRRLRHKKLGDRRCLAIVPGRYSVAAMAASAPVGSAQWKLASAPAGNLNWRVENHQ